MSKNFSRSFSCSRSHKIYIRSHKIKLGSTYAYHALWPLSYDLDKIQDRDKSANRCNGGITFSQKPKLIRSVASDGLTNIYKRGVSLNIYKKGANKFGRKNRFQDWKWKWRSKPIKSKISRDLDSAKMHFRSKFADSSLNGWWVMVWTSSKWGKIWLSS